jgi:hypothetical protein
VYEYRCEKGHTFERLLPVAQYRDPQTCGCGLVAEKVILTPPRVFDDFEGYESPVSGRWIAGKQARREDMAAHHCQPYEIGMRQDAERYRAEEDRKLDQTVDAVVEQTLSDIL